MTEWAARPFSTAGRFGLMVVSIWPPAEPRAHPPDEHALFPVRGTGSTESV